MPRGYSTIIVEDRDPVGVAFQPARTIEGMAISPSIRVEVDVLSTIRIDSLGAAERVLAALDVAIDEWRAHEAAASAGMVAPVLEASPSNEPRS